LIHNVQYISEIEHNLFPDIDIGSDRMCNQLLISPFLYAAQPYVGY